MNVKESKEFLESAHINFICDDNLASMYHHEFTQVGNNAMGISSFTVSEVNVNGETVDKVTATSGPLCVDIQGMTVERLSSTMYGFKVSEAALGSIAQQFNTPMIIPAQQLIYNAFPIPANDAGIQSTINMPVSNCSSMSIIFPKHSNEYTVFQNPIYQNLQLVVNGKNFPEEAVSSKGGQFLQQQLIASDLSAGLECTQEFEDSYIMDKNDAGGSPFTNTLRDGTSFMWNVQLERANAGYTYDGVDSNGQNIAIQLKGQPIFTGANDTYYNVDGSTTTHPPAPQIWLCCDTYFEVSNNGVKYVHNQTPPGY